MVTAATAAAGFLAVGDGEAICHTAGNRGIKAVNGLLFDGIGVSAVQICKGVRPGLAVLVGGFFAQKHRTDCGSRAVLRNADKVYGNSGRIRACAAPNLVYGEGNRIFQGVLTRNDHFAVCADTAAAFCGIAHNLERCGFSQCLALCGNNSLETVALDCTGGRLNRGTRIRCIVAVASESAVVCITRAD